MQSRSTLTNSALHICAGRLWEYALVLSMHIDPAAVNQTVARMVHEDLGASHPLRALLMQLSGSDEGVWYSLLTPRSYPWNSARELKTIMCCWFFCCRCSDGRE